MQGQGVFVDDIKRHNMGYVHFVRSPYAHARIVSVDVSAALEAPGVYGTLTGDEVAILTEPFFQIAPAPGGNIKDYALAVGRARFVGDPVAAVVAATRELARDASELIEVEYEVLDPVVDARTARDPRSPVIHEEIGSNESWSGVYDWGDVEGAFAEADHVVRIGELHFDRFNSTPLELDAALVEYNRGTGQWTIYCNNQFPGFAVIMMGPAMGVGLDKLRMVTQDIGGGFGNKITSHPQLVACCLLARKLNRPVQWTEARTDFHQSMSHGNERWFQDIEVAVKADGEMLGFRCKALDDAGAFLRYEPLGGAIWVQVSPGMYRWRNIRVEYSQVVTNKAPVSPNRGYSRMQHLWLCERIIDIVAHELDLDPIAMRKLNYVQPEQMPYETPSGGIYDSGDYPRALDAVLELIGHDAIEARRADAKARGKLLGFGIGSTLDSGTNNFAQSTLPQPRAAVLGQQRGRDRQARHLRRGRRDARHHAAGPGPRDDDVAGRGRHPRLLDRHREGARRARLVLELARRLLGHLRQPVRGLGPGRGQGRGRRPRVADAPARRARARAPSRTTSSSRAGFARLRANPEVALPFMALGAIVNVNNASLPEDFEPTMNVRHVYRPHFEPLDLERKFGNLTLTYAMQIHACVVEIDPETGVYERRRLRGHRRLRQPHQPADRRGPGHGRDGARAGRGDLGDVRLRRGGQPPDAELLRLPRPARARHAAAQDGRDRVALAVLGARHEGHGRGRRGRASTRSAPRSRMRSSASGGADHPRQPQPLPPGLLDPAGPGGDAGQREGRERMNVEGTKEFEASRERVWAVISDPASMAGLMPGVEGFEIVDDALARQGQGAARARRPQDDDGLRAARGAPARVRVDARQGQGHRRDDGHDDVVHAQRRGRPHAMAWQADVKLAGVSLDGPARAAADHQPAGRRAS